MDTLLATAKKLRALEPYYDRDYNGHIGYAANVNCMPMPASINQDAIDVCEGILNGTVKGEPQEAAFGGNSYHAGKAPSASGLIRSSSIPSKEALWRR